MQSSKEFDDVVLQSLVDTGVAEKIIHAVTATCVTYAQLNDMTFAGFSDDFEEALFFQPASGEIVRIPYHEVKSDAFDYLETQQKEK